LPARDRILQTVLDRLLAEGYLSVAQQEREDGETYEYLDLAEKGLGQLTSGRLLQWKIR
jgi:hypothetical protein